MREGLSGQDIIALLVCIVILIAINSNRIFHNPNRPESLNVPDLPLWCSGILVLFMLAVVAMAFTKRH